MLDTFSSLAVLFAFDPNLTSTRLPIKHHPTMTLTQSMCAKLVSQQLVEKAFEDTNEEHGDLDNTQGFLCCFTKEAPHPVMSPCTTIPSVHVCCNDSTLDSNISLNSVTLSKFNDFVDKKFNEIELQFPNPLLQKGIGRQSGKEEQRTRGRGSMGEGGTGYWHKH